MKKIFKKVYVEISNGCNLRCDFCIGNRRTVHYMSIDEFKIVLSKIRPFTDYLYFHILGEPLLHPLINEFIDLAYSLGFSVNITTNGYLIRNLKSDNIRQINFSLHSFDEKYGISLDDYLNNIFDFIDNLSDTYVSLRVWVKSKYYKCILDYVCNRYNINNISYDSFDKVKVGDNVFLSQFHEFIWPDLDNNYYCKVGKCYGLIDHIGILSDGRIVPCCLDSLGVINLGNIFTDDLNDVLSSKRVLDMISGFKNNKKCEELCFHCNFLDNKKED